MKPPLAKLWVAPWVHDIFLGQTHRVIQAYPQRVSISGRTNVARRWLWHWERARYGQVARGYPLQSISARYGAVRYQGL